MGDSDIFYWDERGTNFPGATNLGAVGAFCSNLANQLEDAITQYNPTLLILRCGTNDMTASGGATPPAEAANRLIEIVETAFSLTDAPIISFGPKPEPTLVQFGFEGRYQEFSDTVIDWSKDQTTTGSNGHVQFTYVDSVEPFLEIGYPNNLFHTDNIHLSTEGYALWDLWLNTAYDAIASGGSPVNCAAWSDDVCIAAIEGGEMAPSVPTPTMTPVMSPVMSGAAIFKPVLLLSSLIPLSLFFSF